jgi:hypothetical protein
MKTNLGRALDIVQEEFENEPFEVGSITHGWFCNIKMPIYDILEHHAPKLSRKKRNEISRAAANKLMNHLFNVATNYE